MPGKFPPTEGIAPNGPMSFPSGFSEPACVGLAELIYLGLIKWQATLNLTNSSREPPPGPEPQACFTQRKLHSHPAFSKAYQLWYHPVTIHCPGYSMRNYKNTLQKQQAALCTSQASTWQAPGIALESHCTGWRGDPRPHETKQFPASEYPQNMTLNSPGTSLDKRRRMQDREKRRKRKGERKRRDADKDIKQERSVFSSILRNSQGKERMHFFFLFFTLNKN